MADVKTIFDPIHGTVPLSPLALMFIDTTEFQRLREVKQLGAASRVYPAANHTRFCHSIGVMHIAKKWAQHLGCFSEDEIELIGAAGLLHDVGHGPFSHAFDSLSSTTHEERSCDITRRLVTQYSIPLQPDEVDTLCNIILGNGKGAMFQIVANKVSGFDVDKWDYLLRDSRSIGVDVNIDIDRLLYHSRVNDNGDISFDHKVADEVFEVFRHRRYMHKHVYCHRVVVIISEMIRDIFSEENVTADEVDSVLYRSSNPLVDRINRRSLYKCTNVDYSSTEPAPRENVVVRKIGVGGDPSMVPMHGERRLPMDVVPSTLFVAFTLEK